MRHQVGLKTQTVNFSFTLAIYIDDMEHFFYVLMPTVWLFNGFVCVMCILCKMYGVLSLDTYVYSLVAERNILKATRAMLKNYH